MRQKICSKCGEKIAADEAVCPHCGFEDLAVRARSSAGPEPAGGNEHPVPGGDRLEHPWPAARRGLDVYRSGLIAKLVILVGGIVLMFLAALGRSRGFMVVLTVGVIVGGVITTIWMLAGLIGYAKVPEQTGGSGAAKLSLGVLIVNLLMELYVSFQVFRILGGNYRAARSFMEQQPYLEGLGNVLGLLGVMALLFSLNSVSRFCGRDQSDRVRVTVVLIVVTTVCAVIVRALVSGGEIRSLAALLFVAGGVLTLAIVTLVKFLGVLNRTRQAMLPT